MSTRVLSLLTALIVTTSVCAVQPARAETKPQPITVEDLFKFKRIADPQMSPDGKLVAYVVTTVDLAANSTSSTIWLAPTDGVCAAATDHHREKRSPSAL